MAKPRIVFFGTPDFACAILKALAEEKYNVIEGICADVIDELIDQGLTEANCGDLEKHAYSVNDGIEDAELRNMHILAAINN